MITLQDRIAYHRGTKRVNSIGTIASRASLVELPLLQAKAVEDISTAQEQRRAGVARTSSLMPNPIMPAPVLSVTGEDILAWTFAGSEPVIWFIQVSEDEGESWATYNTIIGSATDTGEDTVPTGTDQYRIVGTSAGTVATQTTLFSNVVSNTE